MRILTIKQPFATLIVEGIKKYETRSRKISYRGAIAIHSSKKPVSKDEFEWISKSIEKDINIKTLEYPAGKIIGFANVTDVLAIKHNYHPGDLSNNIVTSSLSNVEKNTGHWNEGHFAFELSNVKKISTPLDYQGNLGLRVPEPSLLKKLVTEYKEFLQ